jgi:hypothetical protein
VGSYVEPRTARRKIETIDGVERIRIPMRRNWFVMLFLPVWLTGWAAGWIAVAGQLMTTGFQPFLALWLSFWTVGGIAAISILVMQFWGSETIVVQGGDLEIRSGAKPFVRTWRYRGSAIRNLQSAAPANDVFGMRRRPTPFWMRPQSGAVRFDYGAETMYAASGVDEPEGREIVTWLAKRLPAAAREIE